MPYVFSIPDNAPGIHAQDQDPARAGNDFIGIEIKSFPEDDGGNKNNVAEQKAQEYFFPESKMENEENKRGINQIESQNDLIPRDMIPIPVKEFGDVGDPVNQPENGNK